MPIKRRTDKQVVLYAYDGVLLSQKENTKNKLLLCALIWTNLITIRSEINQALMRESHVLCLKLLSLKG